MRRSGAVAAVKGGKSARQFAVPDHVWREADRYFAQVRGTLKGPAEPSEPAAAGASAEPTP